jgi:hypothetical protein
MSRMISMPTSPNFVQSTFRLNYTVAVSSSPFTGQTKTQEFDRVFWEAQVTTPYMKRSTFSEWQAWITRLKGGVNYFKFADPDALTNTGTYSTAALKVASRIGNSSVTLSFSGNTITAGASTFGSNLVGDYIHVSGANNAINNGTHKITTATSATVVVVDTDLATESNTASCTVDDNVKGSEGLNLNANNNSASGTIKQGDYLAVLDSTTSNLADPVQYLLVTEDATSSGSSPVKYSVRTQPKLRTSLANDTRIRFEDPRGRFRLSDNTVEWTANRNSLYSLSFSCHEVI